MTNNIEERIVSMKFDNTAFESRLADTIRSLDKLRSSLDFANSKRSLQDLSNAGKNFNMGGMGAGIEGVSKKFLALATIGVTTLATLTERAVSSATRMMNAFTLQPVKMGFQEYETNMNAIQTILANTTREGTNLKTVNKALDELNNYADLTIYDFAQMARNIGTFTAAGVKLNTSVKAIKGIANLAAISGSSAEQASVAMYQLSQAMAAGTVKLMDWNSVVNAGMGGATFQRALFETGKALKAIPGIPIDTTFEKWTSGGNSFRTSLESGWLTSEVLTTTLTAMTGDLTQAQIEALGYTKQQAIEMAKLGKTGLEAATKIKTLTQLISTVKESIQSGWAMSFRLLIGDFNEAKTLFTDIYSSISKWISTSADARNKLLKSWKDLGGRTILIKAFSDAISGIGSAIKPIKAAFREIFPPVTAKTLLSMTKSFAEFAKDLKMGAETAGKIKRIFAGFFAGINIGIEIIKQFVWMIKDVIKTLFPASIGVLNFTASFGDMMVKLNKALVAGGGIHKWFVNLSKGISGVINYLINLGKLIYNFFTTGTPHDVVSTSFQNLETRVDSLNSAFKGIQKVWGKVKSGLHGVFTELDKVWEVIRNWFANLGSKIAASFKPGDFNTALDAINVGLLGGLILLFKKFISGGLKFNINLKGGIVDAIKRSFNELTNTLKVMQANIKATTLLKIAGAVALLTASMVVLASINSVALTKALVAMTVGFGQLIGVMIALEKIGGVRSAAKLSVLGEALMEFAAAMVIFALAIKMMSKLSWKELAKGLTGVGGGLALLVAAVNLMPKHVGGMVRAGIGMMAISAGLIILSKAVKSFTTLSWKDMGKGFAGVAVGLGLIAAAMKFMPASSVLSGAGFIEIAVGLNILYEAIKNIGGISWKVLGKGLAGMGGGLVIIAGAMQLMPVNLPVTAAGVLVLSAALLIMSKAVKSMGSIDLVSLAKGLGGIAVVLGTVVLAMNLMKGSLSGAAALFVVSASMLVFAEAIEQLGKLKITEILKGLGAIAGLFAIVGIAAKVLTTVTPTLLAFGASLALIGAAAALFGAGAFLIAKSFEILAKVGKAGVKALIDNIETFVAALPDLIVGIIKSLGVVIRELTKLIPDVVKLIDTLLTNMFKEIIRLIPQFAATLESMITHGLQIIRNKVPDFINTGFIILTSFLKGLQDHIEELATLGINIVIKLADALTANAQRIVTAAVNLVITFVNAIAKRAGDLTTAGINILVKFIEGITNNLGKIVGAVASLIIRLTDEIGKKAGAVVTAGVTTALKFIEGLAKNTLDFITGCAQVLINFLNNLAAAIDKYAPQIRDAGMRVGMAVINGIIPGFKEKMGEVWRWLGNLPGDLLFFLRDAGSWLVDVGKNIISGIWNGLMAMGSWFKDKVWQWIKDHIPGWMQWVLGISSPSKVMAKIGTYIVEGLVSGIESSSGSVKSAMTDLGNNVKDNLNVDTRSINSSVKNLFDQLGKMGDFNPVITPVLDLTKVRSASGQIGQYMGVHSIVPSVSLKQARYISDLSQSYELPNNQNVVEPKDISFTQINNSPKALSTNDIYRATRSQIILAKEKLSIP